MLRRQERELKNFRGVIENGEWEKSASSIRSSSSNLQQEEIIVSWMKKSESCLGFRKVKMETKANSRVKVLKN